MVKNSLFRNLPQGRCDSAGGFRLRSACMALATLLLMSVAGTAGAQITVLANESFRKALPQGWSVYPASTPTAPTWASDTHVTASGKYAMHGYVPYNAGDTVELVTPFYDCTNYKHVQLKFKHICKVLGSDLCQVMYREDNLSSRWKPIPADAYKGGSKAYRINLSFDHSSYKEWQAKDTFAVPSANWYREEVFDMSDYAGYSTVAFKFVIRKGSYFGSFIADGWYLEDFRLLVSNDVFQMPAVSFTTTFGDTVHSTGPFVVNAKVATRSAAGIVPPCLYYSGTYRNTSTSDSVPMTRIGGDSLWTATIPQHVYGTTIYYYIIGRDSIGNSARCDGSFYLKNPFIIPDTNAVAMNSIVNPQRGTIAGIQTVMVTIRNTGIANLLSARIGWSVNGVMQSPVSYKGNLPCDFVDTVTLGTYTQTLDGYDTIVCWVNMPNNVVESSTGDDTLSVVAYGCSSLLSGIYTVGPGGSYDFKNIGDAMSHLTQCGYGGDVELRLAAGVYDTSLDFTGIEDYIGNHRLTVTSMAKNADSVVFMPASGPVVTLGRSAHLLFRDITFSADSAKGNVVLFQSACNDIVFEHCHLKGFRVAASSASNALVYSDGFEQTGIRFTGNRMDFGSYGIYIGSTRHVVTIDSNRFENNYWAAVYTNYVDINFLYNMVLDAEDNVGTYNGIQIHSASNSRIEGNHILTRGYGSVSHAVDLNRCDGTVFFCNNELVMCKPGTCYGIVITNPNGLNVVNNSVYIFGNGTSGNNFGIYANNPASYRCYLHNNNVVIDPKCAGNHYPLYLGSNAIPYWDIDYNNWYGSTNMGYVGANLRTLQEFQSAVPTALHESSKLPMFRDTCDLHLRDGVRLICPVCAGVDRDKDGALRFKFTGIGCYTSDPDSSNGSLSALFGWPEGNTFAGDTLRPRVVIQNAGVKDITSATIGWRVNGVNRPSVGWTGKLQTGETDTVVLGDYNCVAGNNFVEVYLTSIGNLTDTIADDDTVSSFNYTCASRLKGRYTVGGTCDFPNLDAAMSALNTCGMGGPVEFLLSSGSYGELFIQGTFPGADSTNTLTIRSAAGNCDSTVFNGTTAVHLQNTAFIMFRDVTIEGSIVAADMAGSVEDVAFLHCKIKVPVSGSTSVRAVNFNGQPKGRVRFISNTIDGGYYGIYASSSSGNNSLILQNMGVVIDSNTIVGSRYGISTASYCPVLSISHNQINPSERGIITSNYCNVKLIEGNRITISSNSTASVYGMEVGGSQNNGIDPTLVINNLIRIESNGAGTGIAMYYTGSSKIDIHHNSIYVTSTTGKSVGIYTGGGFAMYGVYNDNRITRNLVVVQGNPSYPLDVLVNTRLNPQLPVMVNLGYSYTKREWNNLYSTTNVANMNGAITSIAALQSRTKQDSNSISEEEAKGPFDCPGIPTVTRDINGMARDTATFIGCYHIEPDSNDVAISAITGIDNITAATSASVGVVVRNAGWKDITDTVTVVFSIDGVQRQLVRYIPTSPLAFNHVDTIPLGSYRLPGGTHRFLAYVSMHKDSKSKNDTLLFERYTCDSVMRGTYIIGNSPRAICSYDSIKEVFNRMNICGVSGDITLAFESGTHTGGSMGLGNISEVMGNHHLTITSLAGNRDSVTISNDAILIGIGSSNKNITVSDLTLHLKAQSGSVLNINSGCNNINILRNRLIADTLGNAKCISYSTPVTACFHDSVRIAGNCLYGGDIGVSIEGPYGVSSAQWFWNISVDSNDFYNQMRMGISIIYIYMGSVSHNRIWRQTSGSGQWYGMSFENVYSDSIVGNHISDTPGAGTHSYGMYFRFCQRRDTVLVANNAVKLRTISSGIYEENSCCKFFHNTVYTQGSTGSCFNGNCTSYYSVIKGNLFIADTGQYAFVITGNNFSADYNCYHSHNTNCLLIGNGISNLSLWQATSPANNMHSVDAAPVFVDLPNNMIIRTNSVFLMPPLTATDINGLRRMSITCMGAHNQSVSEKMDAGLVDFAGTKPNGGGNLTVNVTLYNAGEDTLRSVDIAWAVNGVAQTPVKWTGRLANGENTSVGLGGCTVTTGGFNRIKAWVYNPNGGADSYSGNDTASYNEFYCNGPLAGSYTVGGSNPFFQSVEEALKALYTCGVSAPVFMRIRSGRYGSLSFSGAVNGTSANNTVTFTADSAATVVFYKGLSVLNISHIRFQGITMGNTTDLQTGVQMYGMCRDVEFRNCNIYSDTTCTNMNFSAFRYYNNNASNYLVDVSLKGNHIVGGFYNIHLYHMSGSDNTMNTASMYIDSNVMEGANYAGLYLDYLSSVRTFCNNTIRNRNANDSNGSGTYYGLYSYGFSNFERIEGNRIYVKNMGQGYGMYFDYNQNRSGFSVGYALIANNEIRVMGINGTHGMHVSGDNNRLDIHHNSIFSRTANGTSCAMYLNVSTTTNSSTNVSRNLLLSEGGTSYPLYINGGINGGIREWNEMYSLSSSVVGYLSGTGIRSSIPDFQGATGNDANCISVKPSFEHLDDGLELADYTAFSCPKTAQVTTDIYGNPRADSTAMGCYGGKMWDGINLLVDRIVSPVAITNVTCYDDSIPVEIALKNMGRSAACFDSTSLRIDLDVNGAINFHFDTVFTSGTMLPAQTVTIPLTSIPVMNSGKYHIKVKLACNGDVLPEDDTLSMVYNASRVVVPYDEDFSSTPDELLNVRNSGSVDWSVVHDNAMPSSYGTGRLEFAGAGNPGASASAVFNAVDIRGCVNPMLSFWYAHGVNSGTRDILYVFATTDGGASYTTIGRITPADTVPGWRRYDIDLSRFANGSCLSIVFQAISFGGADQYIDRIRISADADASLAILPVETGILTACGNDAVPLRVSVSNLTPMPVEFRGDTLRATVTGASNQSYTFVYSRQLAGYETDTVTMGSMDLRANGSHYINVWMQSQDDNAQNDTASDSTLYIWQDVAIDSIIGIDGKMSKAAGDTVNVSVLLRNGSNMAVERFTVKMELNGALVVEDTVLRRIEGGDSIVHAMSAPYIVPSGTKEQPYYFLELSAVLPCDADAANDARSVVGVISVPDTVDLQVLSIAQPATDSGRVKVSPKVTVANVGNAEVQNVMLHVDVLDSAMMLLETVSEYINFINTNDTLEYAFSLTYTVPNYDGSYYLKAYADTYANEINTANDTLAAKFACIRNTTGIAHHASADWSVGQNEPNPAAGVTVIPFVVPEDAEVVLTLTNVNGQLLHREVIPATAGANRVTLQTGTLPSGLYYYGVEYKGQRIVRKMNVVR